MEFYPDMAGGYFLNSHARSVSLSSIHMKDRPDGLWRLITPL
jgi:hypothetical protein|tara:strand:+ start:599 stop:724 length:126 start_codon:yes stop_codon:yes gene_type:complete